jgi:fructose-bisphosphate aldolase class I
MLLKPNMVMPGKEHSVKASPEEIAEKTIRVMQRSVPAAMPGILFLSGGQTAEEATANLNAMNAMAEQPWELSFSFGRALQQPVMQAWQGKSENVELAQEALFKRAMLNSLARYGRYQADMENE